jgi:hypothetical protein
MCIAVSSCPPMGHVCDVFDRLRERHLHVVLLLLIWTVYSLHSSRVGSRAAVPQLLLPSGCSSRVSLHFCRRASFNVLLRPAVSDRCPATHPREAIHGLPCSFRLEHRDCTTQSRCYFALALHTGAESCRASGCCNGAYYLPVVACEHQIHGCIVGCV